MERKKRIREKLYGPSLWQRWVDVLEPDADATIRRIDERLETALATTGADRHTAIAEISRFGAGHDPAQMREGKSGTGKLFRIFSQPVLDAFLALGGEHGEPLEAHAQDHAPSDP